MLKNMPPHPLTNTGKLRISDELQREDTPPLQGLLAALTDVISVELSWWLKVLAICFLRRDTKAAVVDPMYTKCRERQVYKIYNGTGADTYRT